MRYDVELLEDQILATLVAGLGSAVTVETTAQDITAQWFQVPEFHGGMVGRLPFVFVRYQYRLATEHDDIATLYNHELHWRLFVGAASLRTKREAQTSAYAMLATVFDSLHGKWANFAALPAGLTALTGTAITTTGFNPTGPLQEAGGADEQLLVNLPDIVVYQTDYRMRLQA